ncbi:MAG: hypothetical protein K1X94_30080 [Sandaracinaceae bacterium]|nr:hypothetical protein [Sandaracinaceae bacterium]
MRARLLTTSIAIACLCSVACAGSMAEISGDEREREDEALLARGYHDDVVRLVGDAEAAPVSPDACGDGCATLSRVHGLSDRICRIAERDDHDEATQFLCEDAHSRENSLTQRLASCTCEP